MLALLARTWCAVALSPKYVEAHMELAASRVLGPMRAIKEASFAMVSKRSTVQRVRIVRPRYKPKTNEKKSTRKESME